MKSTISRSGYDIYIIPTSYTYKSRTVRALLGIPIPNLNVSSDVIIAKVILVPIRLYSIVTYIIVVVSYDNTLT